MINVSRGCKIMNSDEGMECPVCWEGFNDGEHTPHVLWCGHSLCRNCVIGLQWAVIKFPFLPIQLPLLIACPWCQYLTVRLTWKRSLKYPCKNFFLLWILESLKGDNVKPRPQVDTTVASSSMAGSTSSTIGTQRPRPRPMEPQDRSTGNFLWEVVHGSRNFAQWQLWAARTLTFFVQLTAKLPLVFLFLFIICYVLPFSIFILVMYCVVTVVLAVPSFLAIYFSYPSLDWLAREIVT